MIPPIIFPFSYFVADTLDVDMNNSKLVIELVSKGETWTKSSQSRDIRW